VARSRSLSKRRSPYKSRSSFGTTGSAGSRYGYGRSRQQTAKKKKKYTAPAWAGKWKLPSGSAPGTSGYRGGSVKKITGTGFVPGGNAADAAREYARRKQSGSSTVASGSTSTSTGVSGVSNYYGGAGGASGSFTPPAVADSGAAERAKEEAAEKDRLSQLRADRLKAALAAIGAQFGYQEGELTGQQRALRQLFDKGQLDLSRLNERNVEGIGNAAAERGILRSGIHAEQQSEEAGRAAEAEGELEGKLSYEEGAEGTEVRSIMSALKLLGQQRAGAESEAKLQSEQDELDVAQLVALMNAGLG